MSDATYDSLLTQTCTIQRRTQGDLDKWGAAEVSINNSATGVACLIQPAYEVLEFDVRGQKQIANFVGYFKITENIEVDDIIVFETKNYAVLGVENAGAQNHHTEAQLRSLENK